MGKSKCGVKSDPTFLGCGFSPYYPYFPTYNNPSTPLGNSATVTVPILETAFFTQIPGFGGTSSASSQLLFASFGNTCFPFIPGTISGAQITVGTITLNVNAYFVIKSGSCDFSTIGFTLTSAQINQLYLAGYGYFIAGDFYLSQPISITVFYV